MKIVILANNSGIWFVEEKDDSELSEEAREFASGLFRDDPDIIDFLGL